MLYQVGDRVLITTDTTRSSDWNLEGGMEQYLGTVMTIRVVEGSHYRMEEDRTEWDGGWYWDDNMIDGLYEEEFDPTLAVSEEELIEILKG